ncbi:MAG: dihydrofolate reductase, partial [Verrucomicrobiota bacterium]
HSILFGRTTYEGIGRPLPKRTNYVLSQSWEGEAGVKVVGSVDEVLVLPEEKVFVCGGANVYRQFFPLCSTLLLTRVLEEVDGDTKLPEFGHLYQFDCEIESGDGYRIERYRRTSE